MGGGMSMSHGQVCRQTYRVRHRDELREAQRRYNREHSAALSVTKRKRDDFIDSIVREIELNSVIGQDYGVSGTTIGKIVRRVER